jgi:hypothetical protein
MFNSVQLYPVAWAGATTIQYSQTPQHVPLVSRHRTLRAACIETSNLTTNAAVHCNDRYTDASA